MLELLVFIGKASSPSEIYTLSLHDALPIFNRGGGWKIGDRRWMGAADADGGVGGDGDQGNVGGLPAVTGGEDRKSTRLNSSHQIISYAVFCLKKKRTDQR